MHQLDLASRPLNMECIPSASHEPLTPKNIAEMDLTAVRRTIERIWREHAENFREENGSFFLTGPHRASSFSPPEQNIPILLDIQNTLDNLDFTIHGNISDTSHMDLGVTQETTTSLTAPISIDETNRLIIENTEAGAEVIVPFLGVGVKATKNPIQTNRTKIPQFFQVKPRKQKGTTEDLEGENESRKKERKEATLLKI